MAYTAHVLRVMIASPSDLPHERDAVQEAVHSWNDSNARNKKVILQPWRWETSAVPQVGGRAQALINAQGVDDSDIVIALFGSRLGSPTGEAVSGTAEEIERAVELGKPVHVYFSNAPLPNDVDVEQLTALRRFREKMQERSLLGEYSNPQQLGYEVWKAIEHDLGQLQLGTPEAPQEAKGVNLVVQPKQERFVRGHDKKGTPRYTTKHWLEITNRGTADARDVRIQVPEDVSGMRLSADGITTIHGGQTRQAQVLYVMSSSGQPAVDVTWTEDGNEFSKRYEVG